MKMIIAIVNRDDVNDVCAALTKNSYMFTKISCVQEIRLCLLEQKPVM